MKIVSTPVMIMVIMVVPIFIGLVMCVTLQSAYCVTSVYGHKNTMGRLCLLSIQFHRLRELRPFPRLQ
jgi:hypothetical protein